MMIFILIKMDLKTNLLEFIPVCVAKNYMELI